MAGESPTASFNLMACCKDFNLQDRDGSNFSIVLTIFKNKSKIVHNFRVNLVVDLRVPHFKMKPSGLLHDFSFLISFKYRQCFIINGTVILFVRCTSEIIRIRGAGIPAWISLVVSVRCSVSIDYRIWDNP